MMRTRIAILTLALGISVCLLTAQNGNQPPAGQRPPGHEGGRGAPGGFHLLPPPALEQLKLTAAQQKQLAALEAEVKVKLEKILTPAQLQQLQRMGPPEHRSGPGGPGGPGSGSQGRPQRPALEQ